MIQSQVIFMDINKLILKFRERQKFIIANSIAKEKTRIKRLTIFNFKIYYKAIQEYHTRKEYKDGPMKQGRYPTKK